MVIKMELNGTNERVACEILALLKENDCTISQSEDILSFVQRYVRTSSTVQFSKEQFEDKYINHQIA